MDSTLRKTPGRIGRGLSALLLVPILVVSLQADSSTQPAIDIKKSFEQLNDRDAAVRDRAVQDLMGLSKQQLHDLRAVAADAGDISPAQAASLHQIVTHVYIDTADYQLDPDEAPFVGLSWPAQLGEAEASGTGVTVARRVPGFSAYRVLRDGDVIVGISELPGLRLQNRDIFVASIRAFRVGQTVHFDVQRAGKTIRVPVLLKQRPFVLRPDGQMLDVWIEEMQSQADAYFDKYFAPVLAGSLRGPVSVNRPPAPAGRKA